ncbi:MAG: hypothetical protein WD988_03130 [Candidatus Curtissbacteria bacterium]
MDDPQLRQTTPPVVQPPASHQPPLIQNQIAKPSHVTTAIIVLLLFFFPLLAWLIMFFNKRYRSWFAAQLIIFGALFAVLTGMFVFLVSPKLSALYKEIGAAPPSSIWLYLLLAVSILQIFFGIYLGRRNKAGKPISTILALVSLTILLIELLGFSISSLSYLSNIYNFTSYITG